MSMYAWKDHCKANVHANAKDQRAALRAALREDIKCDAVHAGITPWSVKGLFDPP
jgi:hypothetical protein